MIGRAAPSSRVARLDTPRASSWLRAFSAHQLLELERMLDRIEKGVLEYRRRGHFIDRIPPALA
jgi:hypothetical protein